MRDIVASIQPEQDALVRADLDRSICVQGAPGTGKTAVGLHRAAYLLYAHRQRLKRGGVLVVGPNRAFLNYIAAVLPALGEVDVEQTTVDELVASKPILVEDGAAAAAVKHDARMAIVLARALDAQIGEPVDTLAVPDGSYRWRIHTDGLRDLVRDVRAERTPYSVGRSGSGLAWWLGYSGEAEQASLRVPRARKGAWSAADLLLIDEVAGLISSRASHGHAIVDEAQDLSPMQCRAIARRSQHGSLTVLGDLAQGGLPWAAVSGAEQLAHLGAPDATMVELTTGYRVPGRLGAPTIMETRPVVPSPAVYAT